MTSLRVEGQEMTVGVENRVQQFDWKVPEVMIIPAVNLGPKYPPLGNGLADDARFLGPLSPNSAHCVAQPSGPIRCIALIDYLEIRRFRAQKTLGGSLHRQPGQHPKKRFDVETIQRHRAQARRGLDDAPAAGRPDRTFNDRTPGGGDGGFRF